MLLAQGLQESTKLPGNVDTAVICQTPSQNGFDIIHFWLGLQFQMTGVCSGTGCGTTKRQLFCGGIEAGGTVAQ